MQQGNMNTDNVVFLLLQSGYECHFNFLGDYIYCIQTDSFISLTDVSVTRMYYLPGNDIQHIFSAIYAIEVISAGISGVLKVDGVDNTLRFISLLNMSRSISAS